MNKIIIILKATYIDSASYAQLKDTSSVKYNVYQPHQK
jgi:hypothetical protein